MYKCSPPQKRKCVWGLFGGTIFLKEMIFCTEILATFSNNSWFLSPFCQLKNPVDIKNLSFYVSDDTTTTLYPMEIIRIIGIL